MPVAVDSDDTSGQSLCDRRNKQINSASKEGKERISLVKASRLVTVLQSIAQMVTAIRRDLLIITQRSNTELVHAYTAR